MHSAPLHGNRPLRSGAAGAGPRRGPSLRRLRPGSAWAPETRELREAHFTPRQLVVDGGFSAAEVVGAGATTRARAGRTRGGVRARAARRALGSLTPAIERWVARELGK